MNWIRPLTVERICFDFHPTHVIIQPIFCNYAWNNHQVKLFIYAEHLPKAMNTTINSAGSRCNP